MGNFSRLIKVLAILSALGAGAVALWRRKDQVKEVWDSFGGVEEVMESANKLASSAGPVKDFVTQMGQLKK